MRTKTVIGWTIVTILCIIPIVCWYFFGDGYVGDALTHSLGEVFGLVGMTMFALTFVLSTRIGFIEDIFGGLDKVYIAHGILGGTALMLVLMHPIFLVLKFVPQNMALAASYLLPSSYWQVNFGIIALLGLILLIAITLFIKLKYHVWKFSHEFLGAVFIIAVLHIFLVRGVVSGDNIFDGYYVYASIVSIIGIASFCYSLFIKGRLLRNAVYVVKEIIRNKNYFEIIMEPEHKPISYKSGQFVFVRFYNKKLSSESHPFSIASKSNETLLKIVVKKLGDYTEQMDAIQKGDKVAVEGPYGRFVYKPKGKDQVWLAAGIGVTPFLGMIQDVYSSSTKEKIHLIYSTRDGDFIGDKLLSYVAAQRARFTYVPWKSEEKGHANAEAISKIVGTLKGKEYFLCGPPVFKDSIIAQLQRAKVPLNDIHEEAFDFI